MIKWMSLALAIAFVPSTWALDTNSQTIVEETLYQNFQQTIKSQDDNKIKSAAGFSSFEQSLFVDALEDLADQDSPAALEYLNNQAPFYYDLVQKLRIGILRIKYKRATVLPIELNNEIVNILQSRSVELKIIYLIAAYEAELTEAGHTAVIELARTHPQYFDIIQDPDSLKEITEDMVADIYHQNPDITTYMNGEYVKSVKIFMFCRNNRLFPCLMVMKNVLGEPVRLADGTLWSNPSLASSSKGLPSYSRNGNTPEGVLTIDSVMPAADSPMSFGKFRRMILNFIPKSKNEVLLKSLLPASSQDADWWRAGVVSRDIGRNLLRIHGTGKINVDKETPYYPFMRTSGCIAQRENTYDGVTFRDQRNLLDSVMKAMDLAASFENETHIKGILYIVEIDDKNGPVALEDLAQRGIE
jgi:hypothetical protein